MQKVVNDDSHKSIHASVGYVGYIGISTPPPSPAKWWYVVHLTDPLSQIRRAKGSGGKP